MNNKPVDVIDVKTLGAYKLYLTFDDGTEGEIDISEIIPFEGVFEPLNNTEFFSDVSLNPELGTLFWKNGIDISPALLHQHIRKN